MNERANLLAARFQQTAAEMIVFVEGCSEDQWKTMSLAENWSVGLAAHHVADAIPMVVSWVERLAGSQPVMDTMDDINRHNEQHAQQHIHCTREETLQLLKNNAAAAHHFVAGLSDEQLDSAAERLVIGSRSTAQEAIERSLIGHIQRHLASIRGSIS